MITNTIIIVIVITIKALWIVLNIMIIEVEFDNFCLTSKKWRKEFEHCHKIIYTFLCEEKHEQLN